MLAIITDILLLFAFNFVLRIAFSIVKSNDEYIHIWIIDRMADKGYTYHVNNSLTGDFYGYPSLPHYIISKFPRKLWILVGSSLNAIYDCLGVVVVYLFSIYALTHGMIGLNTGNIDIPFYTALIYGTTPVLFPVTARLKTFGGRTFGALFSILYFLSLFPAMYQPIGWFVLIAAFFAFITIVSSLFTTQSIIIVSVFMSACYLSPIPLIAVAGGFVLGYVFRVFRLDQIIDFKYKHNRWYIGNKKGTKAFARNSFNEYLLLPVYLFTQPKKFVDLIVNKLTLVIAVYSVPLLFVLILLFGMKPELYTVALQEPFLKYLLIVIGGGILAFILTSFKYLSQWGQAERYLEYSAPFVSILFVVLLARQEFGQQVFLYILLFQIMVILATFIFLQQREFFQNIKLSDRASAAIMSWLNKAPTDTRILTIPLKNSFSLASHVKNENVKFYYNFLCSKDSGLEFMQEDSVTYNAPRSDFRHFVAKYGINTLVVETKVAHKGKYKGVEYDFSKLRIAEETPDYIVYHLD